MDIHIINKSTYSVFLPNSDILKPLSGDEAINFVRSALSVGLKAGEVSMFSGKGGYLFFVREAKTVPELYAFASVEELIDASEGVDMPSSLYFYDGQYILSLFPLYSSAHRFGEFGTRLRSNPELWLHIKEHGKALIPSGALGRIKEVFSENKK